MTKCIVLTSRDHVDHYIGAERSSCFYFPTLDLTTFAFDLRERYKRVVARAARIEVSDADANLHTHPGATIVFITAGTGLFKTEDGDQRVQAGDIVYVPPQTPHLSIADKHTTMIEWIGYIGAEDDRQTVVEVN